MSDPGGLIAQPHSVIDRRRANAVKAVALICEEEDVASIVVGLPVSLSGHEGDAAQAARRFGDAVASETGRNLVYWDERFTSVQAEQALLEAGLRREDRRDRRDMVAAALMLQGYLDASRAEEQ